MIGENGKVGQKNGYHANPGNEKILVHAEEENAQHGHSIFCGEKIDVPVTK
jgi:hypothetical protein